ncbi:aldehyde dehydrogenase family protein [Gordonia hankookensis]|uniref:Aldehyde dehydrogenase n=1 Tax=Gordonia hankookensis TaxID=589403 RepID=A0ABR7WDF0_9ACTN|nr:aldehyde dehydrogenase family protein [Gordonia hankookensis]MBD1320670.1 aldehyde dehydrogenase [Gordonia hankookensis]
MTATSQPVDHTGLDRLIDELRRGANAWASISLHERAALLLRTRDAVRDTAAAWADTAIRIKQTPPSVRGEEWLAGPYITMATLTATAQTLTTLARGGNPVDGIPVGQAPGGRITLEVLPHGVQEALLLNGFSGAIWMPPGVGIDEVRATAGLGARRPTESGGVGLVLGAGNATLIGPLDALYELVAHNRVSVLKLNPTFAEMLPVYEKAFAPLIRRDLLRIINGEGDVGEYITGHPDVGHVHITGSASTHDAIVWGRGTEGERRRATHAPLMSKPITSELGGVSPIIVVPGKWSDADLAYQAENVATQKLQNSGHNCIAGQAMIMSSSWPQRAQFLDAIRKVFDSLPPRENWYPGSDRNMARAQHAYPHAERHGGRMLIEVGDSTSDELYRTEYFSPVLGHTTIPGIGVDFLRNAVRFANDRLVGTLGAGLIVAPHDRKEMGGAFTEAIAELRYGTIGINCWSATGYLAPVMPWGAYPGNTIDDVGSGIGVVHNTRLIADPERVVVNGPFRPFPRSWLGGEASTAPPMPWFVTSKANTSASKALTHYAGHPGWGRIPGVFKAILMP